MKDKKLLILTSLFTFFFLFSLKISHNAYAYSTDQILKATIRIGVCGDGNISVGEDCEIGKPTKTTCEDFGLTGGELRCDRSCHFDVLNCNDVENIESYYQLLPQIIKIWDTNNDGVLTQAEFKTSLVKWVQSWRVYYQIKNINDSKGCDLNNDNKCDAIDLSVLLFYSRYE